MTIGIDIPQWRAISILVFVQRLRLMNVCVEQRISRGSIGEIEEIIGSTRKLIGTGERLCADE